MGLFVRCPYVDIVGINFLFNMHVRPIPMNTNESMLEPLT